jgi:hypothetical protein
VPARLLLVLALLVSLPSCSDDPAPRPGAPSLQVVYRVTAQDGTVTTEVVELAPPYRARTTQHAGDGVTTPVTGAQLWDGTGTYQARGDQALQNEYVAPGFPGPASHLDIALPVAARQGLVRRVGPGVAGDRPCTRWESRLPLDGAPFAPAGGGDRTLSCVGAEGLLLSDTWESGGRVLRRRELVSLGEGPTLDGAAVFASATPVPLPTASSSVVVRRAAAAELIRLMAVPLPSPPQGLEPDASVALLDLAPDRQGFRRESSVLTFTSAERMLVLQISRDLVPGTAPSVRGAPVPLGPGRSARLEPVLAGLRLTMTGPTGLRATVTTDLPERELLAWARELQLG